jgi:microcystin-dependent protein
MSNYTEVSVSGYNSSPPPDDGTTGSDNEISWSGIKTKLADPIKTAFDTCQSNITAAADAAVARVPVGCVFPYAGSAAPSGFLLCNGAAVSRTTYSDLFTVLSTTYGSGDGSTTFNLPDATGRVIAGKESSASRLTSGVGGVDGGTLGAVGGSQSHTLITGELPSHTHGAGSYALGTLTIGSGAKVLQGTALSEDFDAPAGNGAEAVNKTGSALSVLSLDSGTVSGTSGSTGSGTAHANVQPTIVLNYIIKY